MAVTRSTPKRMITRSMVSPKAKAKAKLAKAKSKLAKAKSLKLKHSNIKTPLLKTFKGMKKHSQPSIKKLLETNKYSPKLKEKLIKMSKNEGKGRGSATRGWSGEEPHRGKARNAMKDSCFLIPSEKKFPICAKGTSEISCKGLTAAKIRAHQWQYTNLYPIINKLESKYCLKSPLKKGKKSPLKKGKKSPLKKEKKTPLKKEKQF